jgi:hypothetical protein
MDRIVRIITRHKGKLVSDEKFKNFDRNKVYRSTRESLENGRSIETFYE